MQNDFSDWAHPDRLISREQLIPLVRDFGQLSVGVLGDLCVDIYFDADAQATGRSIETGLPSYDGASPRTFPGGAANVMHNLSRLGAGEVFGFGVLGDDMFGRELAYQLQQSACYFNQMCISSDVDTPTYVKPIIGGQEGSRLDFGRNNGIPDLLRQQVCQALEAKLKELDVLILNQQLSSPLLDESMITQLAILLSAHPQVLVYADCRDIHPELPCHVLKTNVVELAKFMEAAPTAEHNDIACRELIEKAQRRLGCTLVMTRGEEGIMVAESDHVWLQPGVSVPGQIDSVGAGDSVISAIALSHGAGASLVLACQIASVVASGCVSRIQRADCAPMSQLLYTWDDVVFSYRPWLSTHDKAAIRDSDLDLEWVEPFSMPPVSHIIFDHDGTLSTLREGWEAVMLNVMLAEANASSEDTAELSDIFNALIDCTTGVQTITQMQLFAEWLLANRQSHISEVKSASEYKAIYLKKLDQTIQYRLAGLSNGSINADQFMIPGAPEALTTCQHLGARVYLASGTDEGNVKEEADLMGYASVFNGGIYGSQGDVVGDAKRRVLSELGQDVSGSDCGILVVGDGPVEMREGRRMGAWCVGVASDEVTRTGLNLKKRQRLIQSGAHIVVPNLKPLAHLLSDASPVLGV